MTEPEKPRGPRPYDEEFLSRYNARAVVFYLKEVFLLLLAAVGTMALLCAALWLLAML
jgi:hypothetical protein